MSDTTQREDSIFMTSVPEPVLLSSRERIDPQNIYQFEYSITYFEQYLPIIIVEERATTYYTIYDTRCIYFETREEAEQAFSRQLSRQRAVYEHKAIVEQYGVQEHYETIPVYTIDSAPMQPVFSEAFLSETSHVSQTIINPEVVTHRYHVLASELRPFEEQYADTFGYTSLHKAVERERYLQVLLQHYTLQHIFQLFSEHFETLSKKLRQEYEKVAVNIAPASTEELHRFLEIQNYTTRRDIILQRYIMRAIFDNEDVYHNLDSLPLEWIIAPLGSDTIQAAVDESMNNHVKYDPRYLENMP